MASKLFVVATPIGNLQDISQRAIETLKSVSLVAVEDTRHSKKLWSHFGITTPMLILNKDNEKQAVMKIAKVMAAGDDVALISDAGTPLIHDPGSMLVAAMVKEGFEVLPVPGACALVAALSVSGMVSDSFMFCGFLSAKAGLRKAQLQKVASLPEPLVFYESPHRIKAALADMSFELGADRVVFLAREMTKMHEQYTKSTLGELLCVIESAEYTVKGEMVVVVEGAAKDAGDTVKVQVDSLLKALMQNNSVKGSVQIASEITGLPNNLLYDKALLLRE